MRCNRWKCEYYKSYLKAKRKKKAGIFFKILVAAVVVHGMICVSMSYILAWMERTQVVEGVSSTIITEIIAPIVVYGITKTIENIFSKNKLAFSEPIAESNCGKPAEREDNGYE